MKVEEIRREIEASQWDGRRRWYSPGLKAAIIAHAHSRLTDGWKIGRVAAELEIPYHTLGPWMRAAWGKSAVKETTTALVPIRIASEPKKREGMKLVLVNERGFRLEGFDLEQAVVLMERLS